MRNNYLGHCLVQLIQTWLNDGPAIGIREAWTGAGQSSSSGANGRVGWVNRRSHLSADQSDAVPMPSSVTLITLFHVHAVSTVSNIRLSRSLIAIYVLSQCMCSSFKLYNLKLLSTRLPIRNFSTNSWDFFGINRLLFLVVFINFVLRLD